MSDLFTFEAPFESPPQFVLDSAGVCSGARYIPSPNCDERPEHAHIALLVIHCIALPPEQFGGPGVIDLFTNRLDADAHPYFATLKDLRVSAHFFIRRDGELIQCVPCAMRAWHAGVSSWNGHEGCNDFSIGIELEGSDTIPYGQAQYATLSDVTRALFERYGSLDIVGHSDIAPGRKTDPGPTFDWKRYLTSALS